MYDKRMYKCDVTGSLPPPSVTNCHTFPDPLPLERDVLYGRPLGLLDAPAALENDSNTACVDCVSHTISVPHKIISNDKVTVSETLSPLYHANAHSQN